MTAAQTPANVADERGGARSPSADRVDGSVSTPVEAPRPERPGFEPAADPRRSPTAIDQGERRPGEAPSADAPVTADRPTQVDTPASADPTVPPEAAPRPATDADRRAADPTGRAPQPSAASTTDAAPPPASAPPAQAADSGSPSAGSDSAQLGVTTPSPGASPEAPTGTGPAGVDPALRETTASQATPSQATPSAERGPRQDGPATADRPTVVETAAQTVPSDRSSAAPKTAQPATAVEPPAQPAMEAPSTDPTAGSPTAARVVDVEVLAPVEDPASPIADGGRLRVAIAPEATATARLRRLTDALPPTLARGDWGPTSVAVTAELSASQVEALGKLNPQAVPGLSDPQRDALAGLQARINSLVDGGAATSPDELRRQRERQLETVGEVLRDDPVSWLETLHHAVDLRPVASSVATGDAAHRAAELGATRRRDAPARADHGEAGG